MKFPRKKTGEHWSEKVAAEVATVVGIPHPRVELGVDEDSNDPHRFASLTLSFLGVNESLVHGNEVLKLTTPRYPAEADSRYRRTQAHTLEAIRDALCELDVEPPIAPRPAPLRAFGWFVGYLAFDALVGNTDRHHENWPVLVTGSGAQRNHRLAPSYDHASCLGRELTDNERVQRLDSRDSRQLPAAYASRARSAIYLDPDAPRPLSCVEAFLEACKLDSAAANHWKCAVASLDDEPLVETINRVPERCITLPARRFAIAVLKHNLAALKDFCS